MKSCSGYVPSDISGTIELETIPLQTHPGNLIKFQLRGNRGIINVIGSSNEANVQTIRTPNATNIFNSVIENIRSSDDVHNFEE